MFDKVKSRRKHDQGDSSLVVLVLVRFSWVSLGFVGFCWLLAGFSSKSEIDNPCGHISEAWNPKKNQFFQL